MLSRVAERLYWFARYMERTENYARMMLVRHHLVLDLPQEIQPPWQQLIEVLGAEEQFAATRRKPNEKNVINFCFGNRDNSSSIISSLDFARENVRTTREVMPSEVWEKVNTMRRSVAQYANKDFPKQKQHKVLNDVIQRCQQITGLIAGTMNTDAGYQFIRMGRSLERADMTSRIIDVGTVGLTGKSEEILPFQNVLWISVLKSLSAYQMYRLSVRRRVKPDDAINFLFGSDEFPRSLRHCLIIAGRAISILPRNDRCVKIVAEAKAELENYQHQDYRPQLVHEEVDRMQLTLAKLHDEIYTTWFDPANIE